uniref:Uncharacterized protein n=1 Tax=Vitrella brassicaformis TaxID=1169539 RepID=A0A7S1K8D8_9ALVE|mmetsp:Transcript_42458/g.105950  ORF Transcript_42458/g.105950 Transcript_42458/m.105950 type:complete len:133 (+) Transcript_42458:107-505(+)
MAPCGVFENGPHIDAYNRSSQEPIPFLFKLADAHHPDAVTKKTGDTSGVIVSNRMAGLAFCALRTAGATTVDSLFVDLAAPFHHDAEIAAASKKERPLLSGPRRSHGSMHTITGGWDVMEVWQVAYMGQRAV